MSRESQGTPWADSSRDSWLDRLVDTTRRILTSPTAFFRAMPTNGGLGLPLSYAVILGSFGTWIRLLYDHVSREAIGAWVPLLQQQYGWLLGAASLTQSVVQAVLAPLLVALATLLYACVIHVFLMMLGGARRGFEATIRVVAYVSGATAIFFIVPLCGGLVVFAWSIFLDIIGISEAHGVSRGTAAGAVLLPFVVLCCLCGGLGVLVAVFVPAMIGNWAP